MGCCLDHSYQNVQKSNVHFDFESLLDPEYGADTSGCTAITTLVTDKNVLFVVRLSSLVNGIFDATRTKAVVSGYLRLLYLYWRHLLGLIFVGKCWRFTCSPWNWRTGHCAFYRPQTCQQRYVSLLTSVVQEQSAGLYRNVKRHKLTCIYFMPWLTYRGVTENCCRRRICRVWTCQWQPGTFSGIGWLWVQDERYIGTWW